MTLEQHVLSWVIELFELSCWAPGAKALWADLLELN